MALDAGRAAQGARPRAPQREPQVGPGGDRQAPVIEGARAPRRRHLSWDGPMEASTFIRPEKGAELDLRIESLAYGGNGIARMEGYVVFVAGAIPGDLVRAVVTKRKRAYAEARTLEVLEPSPERIAPLADHPGAPWQVLPYARQLEVKQEQVRDALTRIGRLEGFQLDDIVPAGRAVALPQQARVLLRHGAGRRAHLRLPRAGLVARHRPDQRLPAGLGALQRRPRAGARLVSRAGPAGVRPPHAHGPAAQPHRPRRAAHGPAAGAPRHRARGDRRPEPRGCRGLRGAVMDGHRRARRDDAGRRDAQARRQPHARGGAVRAELLDRAQRVLSDEHRDGRAALRDRRRARRPARAGSASTTCTAGSARSG